MNITNWPAEGFWVERSLAQTKNTETLLCGWAARKGGQVVVKTTTRNAPNYAEVSKVLIKEAEILEKLNQNSIAGIPELYLLETCEKPTARTFLVFNKIEGVTLRDIIDEKKRYKDNFCKKRLLELS